MVQTAFRALFVVFFIIVLVSGCALSGADAATDITSQMTMADTVENSTDGSEKGYIKYLPGDGAVDAEPVIVEAADNTVFLPDCMFVSDNCRFIGWYDGYSTYYPGEKYVFSKDRGIVFTALWEEMEMQHLFYTDGSGKTFDSGKYDAGTVVKTAAGLFEKAGYTFMGWMTDDGSVIKPGLRFTVPEGGATLKAVWNKTEDYELAADACEAWELNDGGAACYAASSVGGNAGSLKWTTYLNSDTFGQVLDFSVQGSMMSVKETNLSLGGDFTLSMYVKLPQREDGERVIMSQGDTGDGSYSDFISFCGSTAVNGWSGTSISAGEDDGRCYVGGSIGGAGDLVIQRTFSRTDLNDYSEGWIHLWVWVDDPSVITGGQLEITSYGSADRYETSWNMTSSAFRKGWNELYLSLGAGNTVDGGAVMSKINFVRFYLNCSGAISAKITPPELCLKNDGCTYAWKLYTEADTGILSFEAPGMSGIRTSGKAVCDGKWHHVMLVREGDELTYYIDGDGVSSCNVSGRPDVPNNASLTIGALPNGENGLDGSLASVRLYNKAKTPDKVTSVKVLESDNEDKSPVLVLNHGITTDRSQAFGKEPGCDFTLQDAVNCREMGFDFVRIIIYIDNLMSEDGTLDESYLVWADRQVNNILDAGLHCIFSLAAGDRNAVNGKFHSEYADFDMSCELYAQVGEYILRHENWTPDKVAFLLFCEPVCSLKDHDWTWISDRIVCAVRNVLPNHTILTSSDNYGYLENLKAMSPMTDSNLYYTFTSYEPYTIGFNTFNGWGADNSFWSYLKDIPYPIHEGIDYTDEIEEAISLVPANLKDEARNMLNLYVNGISDAGRKNYYDCLYNEEWHMLRAKSLDDWSKKYGGNIHILAAEFGGCDAYVNMMHFGAKANTGISEKTRLKLIGDSAKAYNAYGISWSFWEYNESFTVFDPTKRLSASWIVSAESFGNLVYVPMLEALGTDYNKALINTYTD